MATATEDDVIAKLDEVNAAIMALQADIAAVLSIPDSVGEVSNALTDMLDVIVAAASDPTEILKKLHEDLRVIHADAAGSWQLDKASGIMTTFDVYGNTVAKFHMTDSESYAHKERRSDLEM